MRTKDEIDKDLKTSMFNLNSLVEASIKSEHTFEKKCENLENHIKDLNTETALEDTLAGQANTLTNAVIEKINFLLDELEQKTGIHLVYTLDLQKDESDK